MEIRIDATNRNTWDRLTEDAALQQNWAYGAACTALGSRVLRLELRRGDSIVGVAQAVHRRLFGCLHAVVCTRGPVWNGLPAPQDRAEALRAIYRALPRPWLRGCFVTPEAAEPERQVLKSAGMVRVMTPYSTAMIDLSADETALRAGMHQKWRNRLVRAEAANLRIGRADRHDRLYHWLLEAEARQQRSRRYAALPPQMAPLWQQAGGQILVLTASDAGEVTAAMLFLIHGSRATYHIGWADAAGKRLNAHNLLLWQAMRKLKAAGVRQLDLGGLNTEDIPGIARFKLGAGGQVRTLCGTWFGR